MVFGLRSFRVQSKNNLKALPCNAFRVGLKEVLEFVSIGMLFAYGIETLAFLSRKGIRPDD